MLDSVLISERTRTDFSDGIHGGSFVSLPRRSTPSQHVRKFSRRRKQRQLPRSCNCQLQATYLPCLNDRSATGRRQRSLLAAPARQRRPGFQLERQSA